MSPSQKVPAAGAEASIRQLIANGKNRAALNAAKDFHKACATPASEALLVDAYVARIQALIQQNLAVEAKALIELVRERYAAASTRLDALTVSAAARSGTLEDLLRPLADPELSAERRAAVEDAVLREVADLAAIAACAALPAEHPLRHAGAALQQAFVAVTTGPVDDVVLDLPEVSRRSPLAPWKLLARAIAYFHRNEDARCRECLQAIAPESVAARLVAPIEAMLGHHPGNPLAPAAAALVAATTGNLPGLRGSLEALDQAFAKGKEKAILDAIRTAVKDCRQDAPADLQRLRQHIAARSQLARLSDTKVRSAMGGAELADAYYLRLLARVLEQKEDYELACGIWKEFHQAAVKEGWFTANGAEAATLYLHMAETLQKRPREELRELERDAARQLDKNPEASYFVSPEQLYARACALDPHLEAFSAWLDWARGESDAQAGRVAQSWHKIRPTDMLPVLFLMESAAKRRSFQTALQYLEKAAAIDGVHPEVRGARLPLLAGAALEHIQKSKLALAVEKLETMAALPQSQQGDRPAFLAALRYMVAVISADNEALCASRQEIERLLGNKPAASLLILVVASDAKRGAIDKPAAFEKLSPPERAGLPADLARVGALAADMRVEAQIPKRWLVETAKAFRKSHKALSVDQLQALAKMALHGNEREFAYAISASGLERVGPSQARFLLLRAQSVPQNQVSRRAICATAAAELARPLREMQVVDEAQEFLKDVDWEISLNADQAGEVLRMEKAAKSTGAGRYRGPNYNAIFDDDLCQCPECRAARGEGGAGMPFEFEGVDTGSLVDSIDLPPGMPREIAVMVVEMAKQAITSGESFDDVVNRAIGMPPPPAKRPKKGRRK